jgi:hypothetical protein
VKKNIAIVGAFDRYNYGDLLFPIIIELYLKMLMNKFRMSIILIIMQLRKVILVCMGVSLLKV